MKNIIIITSDSIRHNYFKRSFENDPGINVSKTYVEAEYSFLLERVDSGSVRFDDELAQHFIARHNTEYDFFSDIVEFSKDESHTVYIKKQQINDRFIVDEIEKLAPDLIVTYGCSIVRSSLITKFRNKIINVHLGISPYYLGSGTNFHCLANNELQFEGYTFMYMDEGIDTGEIIHQSRAEICMFDNPHQIGNRLIKKMTKDFIFLINNFHLVKEKEPLKEVLGKTYKIKDATEDLTRQMYKNFHEGSVLKYLLNKKIIDQKYPIIEQSFYEERK